MIKDRILHIGISEAVASFAGTKWKFFSYELDEDGIITVEVPRGSGEAFVVELPYKDERQREKLVEKLRHGDFIQQTVRIRNEW